MTLFLPKAETVHVAARVRDTQIDILYWTTDRDNSAGIPTTSIDTSRKVFLEI